MSGSKLPPSGTLYWLGFELYIECGYSLESLFDNKYICLYMGSIGRVTIFLILRFEIYKQQFNLNDDDVVLDKIKFLWI